MKNRVPIVLAVLLFLALSLEPSALRAQGSLTPPGPPAPTMKSLDQIEPRTPIAADTTPGDANDTYIISQPGSYYLTTNIVGVSSNNAVEILANNVTLDLNGFTLQGVSTSTTFRFNNALFIPNTQTNITVRNGNVSGWAQGVFSLSGTSANLVFEHLNFANCYLGAGFAAAGMNILGAAVVRDCSFEKNYYGVSCNGDNTVSASRISGCTANDNVIGIFCVGSGMVSGCAANNNQSVGIDINSGGSGCVVSGCTANNNLYGIYIYATNTRVEDNHVTVGSGSYGIAVQGGSNTNNIIIKNSVAGAGGNNYNIASGQIVGPLITTTGAITSSSPWANFSF